MVYAVWMINCWCFIFIMFCLVILNSIFIFADLSIYNPTIWTQCFDLLSHFMQLCSYVNAIYKPLQCFKSYLIFYCNSCFNSYCKKAVVAKVDIHFNSIAIIKVAVYKWFWHIYCNGCWNCSDVIINIFVNAMQYGL